MQGITAVLHDRTALGHDQTVTIGRLDKGSIEIAVELVNRVGDETKTRILLSNADAAALAKFIGQIV